MSVRTNINFMGFRVVGLIVSLTLIGFSFYEWFVTGEEKFGVDFTGGVEVVVGLEGETAINDIRTTLREKGMESAIVQEFEGEANEYSIRLKGNSKMETTKQIEEALQTLTEDKLNVLKQDFVGPTVGREIREAGLTAMIVALIGMLLYISIRFEFRFALGALAALIHDIIITIGVYILSGREISTAVIAALLTIVGYSLNDTIIVFDRIRENLGLSFKTGAKAKAVQGVTTFEELINVSVNQTLSRTMLTSLTTLFVVVVLFLIGGGAVKDLALTLVIGVIVGTYSSIFVASPVVLLLQKKDLKEIAPPKRPQNAHAEL